VYIETVLSESFVIEANCGMFTAATGTGHFYIITKNRRSKPDKLELKKYDPVVCKHMAYKIAKIK